MTVSCDQCKPVTRKNTAAGWLDGGTTTYGSNLNEKGRATISTSLVSDIQSNISNSIFNYTSLLVPLPQLPGTTRPIPPIVIS